MAGNEAQPDGKGPGWEQFRAQTQAVLAKGSTEVLDDGRRWQCLSAVTVPGDAEGGKEREDLRGGESPSRDLWHTGQPQGWGLEPSDVLRGGREVHSSETQAAPSAHLEHCSILQATGTEHETAPRRLLLLLPASISLSPTPSLNPKTCCQNEWEPRERSRTVPMANHVARPVEEGPGQMGPRGKVWRRDNR